MIITAYTDDSKSETKEVELDDKYARFYNEPSGIIYTVDALDKWKEKVDGFLNGTLKPSFKFNKDVRLLLWNFLSEFPSNAKMNENFTVDDDKTVITIGTFIETVFSPEEEGLEGEEYNHALNKMLITYDAMAILNHFINEQPRKTVRHILKAIQTSETILI